MLHRTRVKLSGVEAAVISRRCMAGLLPAMLLAGAVISQSQNGGQVERLAALRQGALTVWFVGAPMHPPQTNLQAIAALHNATPLTYTEQTTGSFGQNASTYGQNSGSYGIASDSPSISTPHAAPGEDAPSATPNGIGYKEQEAGSFGQEASTYGTASSNSGTSGSGDEQNGNSFSQESSSYGTEASNHGQEASNFGNSTSTIADAANSAPQPPSDPVAEAFQEKLEQAFPDLQLKFTEVDPNDLKDRLLAARGTADYPDVLIGALSEPWWNGMQSEFGLAMLQPASFYPNGVTQDPPSAEQFAILTRAPHMQVARAFALWMSESYADCPGCVQAELSKQEQAAAAVATSAVQRLLSGQPLGGEADPAMARGSSLGSRRMLATIGNRSDGDAVPHVEVERASTDGSLAAVALRVVVSSRGVFGVAHPLVVLRMAQTGRWRVLQVSLNLQQIEQKSAQETLMESSPTSAAEQRAGVKGVSQAAPQDGDTKGPMPELVWDNNGGAGLQVVEWQMGRDGGWADARLYLVQDRSPRLQTHVQAEFAGDPGQYRWRVWSVGDRGEMKISPWRTFNVVR
jgi:hypothetical protein